MIKFDDRPKQKNSYVRQNSKVNSPERLEFAVLLDFNNSNLGQGLS